MISLIRIDDRLIHGQVMAVWARALGINHILVADDDAAADAFSRHIMQLAMPPSIELTINTIAAAGGRLKAIESDASHTLILLKSVESAIRLHAIYSFRGLNVGGIGMAPGRKLVWRSIAATPAEIDQLRYLNLAGVDVYLQMIPTDEKRSLHVNV